MGHMSGTKCHLCLGHYKSDPVTRYVGWLAEADLAQFEPLNQDLLSAFHYLRSLCASVWCWARYDVPEKREAAEYHLEYLRAEFGSRAPGQAYIIGHDADHKPIA
jgi:hypothetical protein